MKKLFCIFLIIVIFSSFSYSVYAADEVPASAGTGYIIFENSDFRDLSIATNTLSFDTQNGFDLYFPYLTYHHSDYDGCYVIFSGSLFFNTSNGANSSRSYDFSTVYPTSLKFDLNDDGTYGRTVDLLSRYDSDDGYINLDSSQFNFSSQMHYFDDGVDEGFIITYIFISRSSLIPLFRDATISFTTPAISDGDVRSSNFKCLTVARPSDAVEDAINTMNQSTIQGLGGVQTAVNALSTLTQNNFASTEQLLNSLDAAISDLKGSVTDSVNNALDEWESENLNSSKSEITAAVSDVQEQIDDVFDFSDVQEATSIIYDAVSTDSMDPQIDIPAFSLNLFGQTFTFWDSIHFDFQSIYNTLTSIAVFNILLTVFRFTIVCGCIYYCWHWLNKLINLVLLESDGSYGYATHAAKFPIEREISRRERGGK